MAMSLLAKQDRTRRQSITDIAVTVLAVPSWILCMSISYTIFSRMWKICQGIGTCRTHKSHVVIRFRFSCIRHRHQVKFGAFGLATCKTSSSSLGNDVVERDGFKQTTAAMPGAATE
jgi:hypothetical protein